MARHRWPAASRALDDAPEQRAGDRVGVTCERLVDRVVDHFVDQMVQAALTGRADVHARALTHRLEPLEHLDVVGSVTVARSGLLCGSLFLGNACGVV